MFHYIVWWLKWIKKYWIEKHEYDDEAKHYLIRKNLKLSEDQFHSLESKAIDEYIALELWKRPEFERWKEEKELEEKEKLGFHFSKKLSINKIQLEFTKATVDAIR